MRLLTKTCDRLLTVLAPKGTASAVCYFESRDCGSCSGGRKYCCDYFYTCPPQCGYRSC